MLDFLAGMLIARWAGRAPAPRPVPATLAFALLLLPDRAVPLPLRGTTCLGATLVVGALVNIEPLLKRVFPPRLAVLEAISYSFYLFHPIVTPGVSMVLRAMDVRDVTIGAAPCMVVTAGA